MSDEVRLTGLSSRQAVEEIAHEIRTRQLSILSLVQILRRIESGEIDVESLPPTLGVSKNLDSIQQCVHEISQLMDTLVEYVREDDSL